MVSIASAQKFKGKPLLIINKSFIVTIVIYSSSAILFSSCIYAVAYLIMIFFLSEKFFSLAEINFSPLSIQSAFIDLLYCYSTINNHI